MTAPGFVPRPTQDLYDRIATIEKRLRNVQQNVAGATVAGGGVPLSSAIPQPVGTGAAGTASTSSRADHVHSSALSSSSGGGTCDFVRWGDQLSTMHRTAATIGATGLQTIAGTWPLPAGQTYTFTGVRYCLSTAATATASIGAYVGTALNSLARQGSVGTQSVTTGTNGVYQFPFGSAITLTPSALTYICVIVTFTAGQTVAANENTITANMPWQAGNLWAGTATTAVTLGTTFDASAAVTTQVPWVALY